MSLTPDMTTLLLRLGAATLHEAQGQAGAMDSAIKPVHASMRLAGPAVTVATPPGDNLMIHYAVAKAGPGDILVVDAQGFLEGGAFGDILAVAAMARGVAGLVIDGSVRDIATITELGFPAFSRGVSIKGTNKTRAGRFGEPVACGGVVVKPGDIVVGDADGVVVIPSDRLSSVLDAAREREAKEDKLRAGLKAGRTTIDLLGLDPTLRSLGLA